MLHKAWNSKGEMPYRFPMSSVKFQGHAVQNITDFDPNWAFPDYRPVAAFKSLRFALLFKHLYFKLNTSLQDTFNNILLVFLLDSSIWNDRECIHFLLLNVPIE